MKCKAYELIADVEVQSVTCPGVWLCPRGNVSLQISMLDLCAQTTQIRPLFPLTYHECFTFRKVYSGSYKLNDLEALFAKEPVYVELIQWEERKDGNVLAIFKTTLLDLLYPIPSTKTKGVVSGIDIELLMEATDSFPGIISPKVEVATKTTIEEVLCIYKKDAKGNPVIVNPKVIISKNVPRRPAAKRQKKVCHLHRRSISSKNSFDDLSNATGIDYTVYKLPMPTRDCSCSNSSRESTMYEKIRQRLGDVDSPRYNPDERPMKSKSYEYYSKNSKMSTGTTRKSRAVSHYTKDPKIVEEKIKKSLHCECCSRDRKMVDDKIKKIRDRPVVLNNAECLCYYEGNNILCPLCTKYKYYFDTPSSCHHSKKHEVAYDVPPMGVYSYKCSDKAKTKDLDYTDNVEYCKCGAKTVTDPAKPSLARQLHNRLINTLNENRNACSSSCRN